MNEVNPIDWPSVHARLQDNLSDVKESTRRDAVTVLVERADRLASRRRREDEESAAPFLLLEVAGQMVALSASAVEAIVKIETVAPVPEATKDLLGLINFHNELYCLIDPSSLIASSGPAGDEAFAFAIVLRHRQLRVALACDDVLRVENIPSSQWEENDVFQSGDRFGTMINIPNFLAAFERGALKN